MQIYSSLNDVLAQNIVLTIGNFDGVHKGHQDLLNDIKSKCSEDENFVVISFVPHPKKVLDPSINNFLISSYNKKREFLVDLGIEHFVELAFDRDFSTLTPNIFLDEYVVTNPNVKKIYVGYDFAFGANKSGDHDFVKSYMKEKGIDVVIQEKFEMDYTLISSTVIRNLITSGDVNKASEYLGRNYILEGVVVKGEGRGKKIGFPTANIQFSKDLIFPGKGVYQTKTKHNNKIYNSLTNIGVNPTFKDDHVLSVETHILNFELDIYGESIEVEFISKLRDEKKFNGVEELISQISSDIESVKDKL